MTAASPQERAAILNDPTQLGRVLGYLDSGSGKDRALAILKGTGTGDTASAYEEFLAELDSWLWVSDATIWGCLERMNTTELVRLRGDTALVRRIEEGISDVPRLRAHRIYVVALQAPGHGGRSGRRGRCGNGRERPRREQ